MIEVGIGIIIGLLVAMLNITLWRRAEVKGGWKNILSSSKATIVELRSPIEDVELE